MLGRQTLRVAYAVAGLYVILALVIAVDAETDEPTPCVSCVVPAPHAWEDKR